MIKPFGFEITDSRLKRSGLDYWQYLDVKYYNTIDAFFSTHKDARMVFLSSHGKQSHWDIEFTKNLFLVFGKESVGLDKSIIEKYQPHTFNWTPSQVADVKGRGNELDCFGRIRRRR